MRTCAPLVLLGLCPKLKYPPLCGGIFICHSVVLYLPGPRVSKLAGDISQLSASCGRCSETEQLKHRELKAGAPAPTRNDLVRRAGTDS